jgi:putative Holliday junction resolvase
MSSYLGLDLGSVTCGVSWSETGMIASTVMTIRFHPDDYDTALDRVLEIVKEKQPDRIVLGLPLLLNGDAGERAQICMEFGEVLGQESGVPVDLWDERFTTREAEAILLEADVSRKKRKKKIDQLAAVQILQSYLDSKAAMKRNEVKNGN